jgi:protein-S-isoprenylcysteine O-methyltransferase Ste14
MLKSAVLPALHTLAWLACVVYSTIPGFWLFIHSRVEYWRSRRRLPYRVLVAGGMATWIVVALITRPWRHVALYRTPWLWIPAAALFTVGLGIYGKAGVNFSKQQLYGLSELRAQNAEQRLVTSGIRARLRHPVYLGHLCEMLAWSAGSGLIVCYALTTVAIVSGALMIQKEDAELEQRFGDAFRHYRNSVPALFPKL